MNRKGIAEQIIYILIIFVILITILVVYFAWSMLAPSISTITGQITNSAITAANSSGDQNLSVAATTALSPINNSLPILEWGTYFVLIMLFFGFLILCFFVRAYPFLIFFWVILIIILAFVSLFLTDSYLTASAGTSYVATADQGWTTNNFIMSNLPSIFVAVGIFGGIILFILVSREQEAEAGAF